MSDRTESGHTHRTRAERARLREARRSRSRLARACGAVVAISAIAALVYSLTGADAVQTGWSQRFTSLASDETTIASMAVGASVSGTATQALIEMPSVVGTQVASAEFLLKTAGFTVTRTLTPVGNEESGTVLAQVPAAGELIALNTVVTLTVADPNAVTKADAGEVVVCIDPGHQKTANLDEEAVGPDSSETKAKVSAGATGAVTGQTEYELALALSLKVKKRLEASGITVVLTRTTNNVDISNAQRAEVANQAGADLFLRIHADSNVNAELSGISTLYPGGNDWVKAIGPESLEAATLVHEAVITATGAKDRGLEERSDLAGFNYASMPSILVEAGFLSNPAEDKLLATGAYQDKLADGIAAGVLEYLSVSK